MTSKAIIILSLLTYGHYLLIKTLQMRLMM